LTRQKASAPPREVNLSNEFLSRPATAAHAIARLIASRGLERVYGLPGGHVKPIWDELDRAGVRIVSTRHECAAVHMAQAEAELSGELAVAIVTTGPGLTNATTGIACADLARSPVLILSAVPPRPQAGMGALEEIDQAAVVAPITRLARSVAEARHVLPTLDLAIARAIGEEEPPGPAYVDFATGLLSEAIPPPYEGEVAYRPRRRTPMPADPIATEEAAELIGQSRCPLVIAGAGIKQDAAALRAFLETTGALCVDTRESKGAVPLDAPGYVPAARARAIAGADLVITVGRTLDFELAYGSSAVFRPGVKFLRIGRSFDELARNRRGDVELRGDVPAALEALVEAEASPVDPDRAWRERLIAENAAKVERLAEQIANEPAGSDGLMHPYSVLDRLNLYIDPETIVIADGGDILAFARVALRTPTYLDLGPFGCLGVGVPFANAAALARPERRVIAVIGDGSFGFNAMEVETAVRERARVLLVVVNNSAWNIERQDQIDNYDGRIIGTELSTSSYSLMAESLGAHGERVQEADELGPALERALANLPAVVDVSVTREAISPDSRSGLASVPSLQAIRPWDDAERRWLRVKDPKGDEMSVSPHEVEGRERPRGYSDVTSGAGVVAIAGQLPAEDVLDGDGGLPEQFASAMARFVEALGAVGAGPDDILSMRIYVTSAEDYRGSLKELAPVFQQTFDAQYPAMTLLEVSALIDERAVVEIEGLAAKP
jgi:thiamine pyrophosphate-dependent acetolactate synthase large subunit-like protein/enamine deaminase RidA (YjgF/YER057c/UK114 family)